MRDLIGALRRKRKTITNLDELAEAIRASAAYLAQGASYSYLRARSLMAGPRLFSDEGFGGALDICKWEAFGVACQDLILILEAELRSELPLDIEDRRRVFAALYSNTLAREIVPEHRKATGWDDMIGDFAPRLVSALSRPPMKPDLISIATAQRILDHAPIDPSVRAADEMMVVNNVAFRFIDQQAKLRGELDIDAITSKLTARMAQA
ncbi:MAG: esterase [Hoeflea sp.]|uniref:esterase n=1 Tax=Hoeflea sp. TaxID=1940281 RepID=UPI001DF5E66C|nr:esterase [Hoeflea sp.]MBU4531187.1 esterase [Alphaproteobacteria bacterium]MBU4545751.1 esterase [Alphaproteobacteria bacterium]MBU4550720.1 esterase [Alphaproteobacteria bacterium]MBV1724464.1 esterase [Hoeflea sp.]MBV1760484.1 esterase [Hoeflea sp.]